MERVIHRAASRGFADHGWLQTYHTFSYGNYYDPRRIHFGSLRILNDDTVEGGEGFSSHPHDNMEIVLLPLEGALEHGDNIGNITVVRAGDVQVVTAGTGVIHNVYNKSRKDPLQMLEIWVYPREYELSPGYSMVTPPPSPRNELRAIVAPENEYKLYGAARIAQDAWFYTAELDAGVSLKHELHTERHGVYIFVLNGSISIGETEFGTRDGVGIWDVESVTLRAESDTSILLMEVPMRKEQL